MDVARFNDEPGDGQRYDIRMKAKEGSFEKLNDLNKIYLRSKSGELIRLDTIASFHQELGPAVMGRQDLQYSSNFYGPFRDRCRLVKNLGALNKDILPGEYSIQLEGQAKEFAKTMSNVIFVFILATILLYMVLASLFNSFFQPLIVMFAQPSSNVLAV